MDTASKGLGTGTIATPPETPMSLDNVQPSSANRALFHNYLRAFCHFEPPAHVDKNDKALRATVALEAGDLILVHSVHANGWADGTVLSTGARGWLPTNYCETFDHPFMRHLLNATTQFWDLLGINENSNLSTFVRQDYIRPLIAGVRYLLEHADCLHRDAPVVQRNAGLRRLRKGLLADLSILVQIAKRLQEVISEPFVGEVIHVLLDDLMARAFKVVTRAVGFADMLGQERMSMKPSTVMSRPGEESTIRSLDQIVAEGHPLGTDAGPIDSAKCFPEQEISSGESQNTKVETPGERQRKGGYRSNPRTPKSPSVQVSHRLSMIRPEHVQCQTLASEQLAQAHDLCISHIGSFIGLYLHSSRPASELAMTTERLICACRSLLTIAGKVATYEPERRVTIQQARTNFQHKLDELIKSTEAVFVHSEQVEDDVVMVPEQTNRLIDVGTGLIRTVGDCVVKTRKVIELVGDFDLDDPPVQEQDVERTDITAASTCTSEEQQKTIVPDSAPGHGKNASSTTSSPRKQPRQRAQTATDVEDFAKLSTNNTTGAQSLPFPASHQSLPLPARPDSRSADTSVPTITESKYTNIPTTHSASPDRQCSVGPSISSSMGTHTASLRDSGFTAVSEGSTRATTPDQAKDMGDQGTGLTDSFGSLASLRSAGNMDDSTDAEAQLLQKSFANELTLNKDGQVTGGSLPALVEQLTLGDVAPDPQFVAAFFVTFRSFTTPRELAQALIERFDYIGAGRAVGNPVRLRVYNVFKGWLETYWNAEADRAALGDIRYFALHKLKPSLPQPGDRLVELTRTIGKLYHNGTISRPLVSSVGKTATSIHGEYLSEASAPEPIITKAQLNAQRTSGGTVTAACTVLDFDPLELARQMTILASKTFCEIQPAELLSLEWNKKDSTKAENVRKMCILNTDVAHVVGDTILAPEDAKKRALVIKQWSKVAMRCLELSNYESLMAIMCSLNSSVVQRLKRTWEIVSKKTKARLAELNTVVDFSKNQASLRRRLEKPFAPCLPFLGIYLTDLTMVDAGNPKLRELPGSTSPSGEVSSVINFDKHMRMAKIVSHVQKFQVPYNLKAVPEMQEWVQVHLERMRDGHREMVGKFHRRSLVIEPKAVLDLSDAPKMPEGRRATEPSVPDEQIIPERPKTAASGQGTVRTFKPHGQTFDFLLKTNFNFKSRPEVPRIPDDMGQK